MKKPLKTYPMTRSDGKVVRVTIPEDEREEAPPRTVWFADFELGRYQVQAFGATKAECEGALVRTVSYHVEKTGADPSYLSDALEFEATQIVLGVGYRDGSPCGPHAAGWLAEEVENAELKQWSKRNRSR